MKKTKLIVLMSILSMMMVLCLGGCGKSAAGADSPVVGTWTLAGGESQGITIDAEALGAAMGEEGASMSFEFKKDGSLAGSFMGETAEGTWKDADGVITMTFNGDSMDGKIVDGQLHMEADGTTLFFEKK